MIFISFCSGWLNTRVDKSNVIIIIIIVIIIIIIIVITIITLIIPKQQQ